MRWIFLLALLISPILEAAPRLELSMRRAIELALSEEGSAKLQAARELTVQAESRATEAKSALLPNFEIAAAAQNVTTNLAVIGLTPETLGFPIPDRVGPFGVFDARLNFGQKVFDLSSIYRYRAAKASVEATRFEVGAAAEKVAGDVARAYLAALRGESRVARETANLKFAESLLESAKAQQTAGVGSGLDVIRTNVNLAAAQQKLVAAETERRRARLQLSWLAGLRMDLDFALTDELEPPRDELPGSEAAIEDAMRLRPEWQAQEAVLRQAGLASRSSRAERLPTVEAFADYGALGSSPLDALGSRSAGVSIRIPVFDGSRRKAHRSLAASEYRRQRAEAEDLRLRIEFEVRTALDRAQRASGDVAAADAALEYSEQWYESARRRYYAGAEDNLAVIQAQNQLAGARDRQAEAVYGANVAWVELQQAVGRLREDLVGAPNAGIAEESAARASLRRYRRFRE